jgi:hypothetical protein
MWLEPCAAMRFGVALLLVLVVAACRPPGYGKDDEGNAGDVDAAPGGDGTTSDGGGFDAAAATCSKEFRLEGRSTASSVWLTGSFNSWAANPPGAIVLTQGVDGAWSGSHDFAAGLHQYKFIVSGEEWIPDPANPDGVDDGFGSRNSLYSCVP